jgi:UDP-glucose:(heptosyl)LPS alpha-1,3-glucosyltransferase
VNIAFCYESVLPNRGGCETYIASLAHRLVADGQEVHLYGCRWDEAALPDGMQFHAVDRPRGPRFLRPWQFSAACRRGLAGADHDVTVGFDKIAGLDVLYPQGGIYAASAEHNLLKHPGVWMRRLARIAKALDPAHHSFLAMERAMYRRHRPLVIAISDRVRGHLEHYYGYHAADVRVVRVAANPARFDETDRPRRRAEGREHWQFTPDATVGLFVGINYRLKGLEPLLHALRHVPRRPGLHLLVVGRPESGAWQRLAHRLGVGDRVRFAGYCDDVRTAYFTADFLVHPTFYDPCSNVVVEALSCGIPVITSQYNGAGELMHPPREGYVIDDPHNHAHLAWCLERMLDPARRSACAAAARRTAQAWTFEHHYRAMLDVFVEAIRRKQPTAPPLAG